MAPSANDEAFLRWEYTTSGRSPEIWTAVAVSLLRSADLLWQRAAASAELWERCFTLDQFGLPAQTGRRLTDEELEIFRDREVDRSALLLLGFAIENLAKSVLIGRNPALISDDGAYKGPPTHNLPRLVVECGLTLDANQRGTLDALKDYVEWLGRYPIPMKFDKKTSGIGAWVPHRLPPRDVIWGQCRPIAEQLAQLREL